MFHLKRIISLFSVLIALSLILASGRLTTAQEALVTDTPAPLPTRTRVGTIPPTNTRRPTFTPSPTLTPTLTPTATWTSPPHATFIATPGGVLGGGEFGTWTPVPVGFTTYTENFIFTRPIPADFANYPARNYLYGSRDGGGRPTHHGLDFQNPSGTPVIAAAAGVVEYAGPDIQVLFGPQPNFYGNVIVIRHNFADVDGRAVYTLYGHLFRINVTTGQPVQQGELIGLVGSAGVAVGAHLHFEVRVGKPNDYTAVRNPELWIQPYTGNGVIAGRVMDIYGNKLSGVFVSIIGGAGRDIETYWDDGTPGDTRLNENFVAGDLQAGYYQVIVRTLDGALKYRNTVFVRPYRVTPVEIYMMP